MKTLDQLWNTVIHKKQLLPFLLLIIISCNQQHEKLSPDKILKAKPIHKIPEENIKQNDDKKTTPPDSIQLKSNGDSLQQMSKDTTETMDQAPKKPATMPKKYFKLNIHKRPMVTMLTIPTKQRSVFAVINKEV